MSRDAEIRVSVSPGEVRVAVLRDGRLEFAAVERPAFPDGVGDLHRARVTAVSAAMSGAFLALGGDQTGFLPENEAPAPRRPIGKAVHEGMILPVRIIRAPQGGKGPRVSARVPEQDLALAASVRGNAPLLLRRGDGAALRFAALLPGAPVVTDGAAGAAVLRERLGADRVRLQLSGVFDDELEGAFDELASPVVALDGGGRLLIHPTPALTAIDVDAGTAAGLGDAAAHAALNRGAAAAIARQIRLRNLGGAILVDFAGMSPRQRESLVEPLAAALGADPVQPRLLGLTRLGLMEIVRPRVHPPLHEVVGMPPSPLTCALAALRRGIKEVASNPGRTLALHAAPEVIRALDAVPAALEEYRGQAGHALSLQAEPGLRPGQERIVEKTG